MTHGRTLFFVVDHTQTGLDSKRTVHVIANPIDGILGIQTEIANPANPSARSTGSVNAVRQLVGGHGLAVAQSRTSSHSSHSGGSGELARGKGYKLCGVIPWVDYEDLPDLPKLNMLDMGRSHPVRLKLGDIALNGYLDLFWSVVGLVHAGNRAALEELSSVFAGKLESGEAPQAYVCVRGRCEAPVSDPDALRAALESPR